MAKGQLHNLVGQLRRAVLGPRETEATDGELLKQFVTQRDGAAFAALVRRYGPLVFGVCRRILHHRQDAEDAFQATFLVLLHKANSIAQPELVGHWLYGVAAFTARNARTRDARRLARERQVLTMPSSEPLHPDDELRELRTLLDEELSRLPEKYRLPLVLCELQGKARKDVARQLGCPEGTLSSRLARARVLLRVRLNKRGLVLSTGSLTLLLGREAAASVPTLLVASTITLALRVAASPMPAAGIVSTKVAALVEGALKTMFLIKLKTTTAVVLALGVLTGAGLLAHQASTNRPSSPTPAAQRTVPATPAAENPGKPAGAAESTDKDSLTITGRVLDPTGMPVAGARLYLLQQTRERSPNSPDRTLLPCGSTDKAGQYRLPLPPGHARAEPTITLLAAAAGFGLDWRELPIKELPEDVVFRLVEDVPIRGRVLSTEGKPLAGVTVQVEGIVDPGKLDEFFQAAQRGWRAAETRLAKQLSAPLTPVLHTSVSGQDGRWEMSGAGADRLVNVRLSHAALAQSDLMVITHTGTDIRALVEALAKPKRSPGDRREPTLLKFYPASFEHIAEPGRVIEGTVREAGSGKPIPGVMVQANGNAAVPVAISDAQGNYRIQGLRKANRYVLRLTPPADRPLIGCEVALSDTTPLLQPIRAPLELSRGGQVIGRVLDKATGRGVESFVQFVPLPENAWAAKERGNQALATFTDAAGRFHLGTIPGSGVLLAQVLGTRETQNGVRLYPYPINRYKRAEFDAADRKRVEMIDAQTDAPAFRAVGGERVSLAFFNACKVVEVKEGEKTASCDLVVDPGQTLSLQIRDTAGKPLAGAVVLGTSSLSITALSLKDSTCPVYALDRRKPRQLVMLHPERELAALRTVRGDEPNPQVVQLTPSSVITGRLVDGDGQPVVGASVAPLYVGSTGGEASAGPMGRELVKELRRRNALPQTDAAGRFRLGTIIPGLEFKLLVSKEQQQYEVEPPREIKPLTAGQTLDLGEVTVKAKE